jgi:hypothetical protein
LIDVRIYPQAERDELVQGGTYVLQLVRIHSFCKEENPIQFPTEGGKQVQLEVGYDPWISSIVTQLRTELPETVGKELDGFIFTLAAAMKFLHQFLPVGVSLKVFCKLILGIRPVELGFDDVGVDPVSLRRGRNRLEEQGWPSVFRDCLRSAQLLEAIQKRNSGLPLATSPLRDIHAATVASASGQGQALQEVQGNGRGQGGIWFPGVESDGYLA